MRNLQRVQEQLKPFSHVNKKAFEQYNNFIKQQEHLQTRKAELDESAKVCTFALFRKNSSYIYSNVFKILCFNRLLKT